MDCKTKILELREMTGMNRREFCEHFQIPYRTVTEWERDNRHAPEYVLRLLEHYIRTEGLGGRPATDYALAAAQLRALVDGITDEVTILSNTSALIWENWADINWAGFYVMREGKLHLGPFQGKTACMVIPVGRGVCGTAVAQDATIRVEDVHQFPGHIACDSASNSEIVVPIHVNGEIYGVLDIDSPYVNRFTAEDQAALEEIVRILEASLSA